MWMDLWERSKQTTNWPTMFQFASCTSANANSPSWTLSNTWAKSQFAGRWLLFMGWS
jgi:hypothetical protein